MNKQVTAPWPLKKLLFLVSPHIASNEIELDFLSLLTSCKRAQDSYAFVAVSWAEQSVKLV